MKCLILAAGYATRLYPLTENFPKPLLIVGEKPILDWLIDDLDTASCIDEYIVISNHRYAPHFQRWAAEKPKKITVIDDGTSTNETRLGAVKDIQFAIDQLALDDDLLVIAGDNVLDFSLTAFLHYAKQKATTCIMRYYEPDKAKIRKSGAVVIDQNDLVLSMEEKPENPSSHWCTPPFYFYTRRDTHLVKAGIEAGCATDSPGSFIAWLSRHSPVHAMEMPGMRYDIGTLETYQKVQSEYRGIFKR